ncbi:FAD-binding oxidoreductase [Cryptosporangium phraense]|uniref:FAD-binding oxidoreductase n=2 Tax=Cryptosporangium phraense TaxID=2593070 RepID=A0A545B0P0_9ACTN|nr:FAD-binding oxidoreductase [Cryptosporangium phraense]
MTLDPGAVARLAADVTGPVLQPGDDRYDEETATWNLALSHRAAVVVGAATVADVQAAVRFAAARDLPVAVVATGHGAAVSADDAVMINVRRMDGITIDADARTATVGPAARMQALIDAAAENGLAPIAGSATNVGVVSFTLGGGLSPALGRTYGYAADHVLAAEIVTPDGELRTIDADTEPDLFWAVRGAKGNFGVVTSLTVGLVPVTRLYGGAMYFGGEHVDAVLDVYRRLAADAPDELTLSFAFLRLPPAPFVPEPLRGRFSLHVRFSYLGSAADGERIADELRAAGPRLVDTVAEMPYTGLAAIHSDPVDPLPVYELSTMLREFPREAADALVAAAGPDVDTAVMLVEIRQFGGALGRDPQVPNAVAHRDAPFQCFVGAAGEPGMKDALRGPLEGLLAALAPWSTGEKFVNFLTSYDTTADAVERAYEPVAYARLVELKTAYDPQNLFRINHNIPPAG